jgi:Ca-activated chloride channel family protein
MKRLALAVILMLGLGGLAQARGIVIPVEKSLPPLAMLNHRVAVTLEDQVATTRVEQTFRNHTSRQLEAEYIFPVPRGASVREFAMWVDGKKVKGELVDAARARQIYTDIVRRTQDPGLLEYIGADLLKMHIFPVPPRGDQKIEISYQSIAPKDHDIVEYVYPLKSDSKAITTLEDFALKLTLKSQQPIINIYSPTHAVSINRTGDREAEVNFEKSQSVLDKDFQLFYTTGQSDVGLTALLHRPISSEDGYFLLLVSPRAELAREQHVLRDMVFVIDTSGSMREDGKIEQARRALKHCLDGLKPTDRFAIINFATTVNRYRNSLTGVDRDQIEQAKKWVDRLEPTGGTAINEALLNALELQSGDATRTFTLVFFTDGKPTIGETNTDKILANLAKRNTAQTRIFTLGLGHDLNAAFLDQVAESTRAVSTFIRPSEDMEAKVSSFFGKISHPVLANLKLESGDNVSLLEVYPPNLPDLFHGGQLVVLGRYHGAGHTTLKLTGTVGTEKREFVYELDFPSKTSDKSFVEDIWARRKVGYLLEQIRTNGEKKELVDEVTSLAKKYGISTPYTSYLIVPDAPMPVAQGGAALPAGAAPILPTETPLALKPTSPGGRQANVADFARNVQRFAGEGATSRGGFEDRKFAALPAEEKLGGKARELVKAQKDAESTKRALDLARGNYAAGRWAENQVNQLGVELSVCSNNLKCQDRLQQTALRRCGTRNCLEIGGVWIDEGFNAQAPTLVVKAMSDAYFQILDRHPEIKDVYQLGNHVVWMTPSGAALVLDTVDGKEQLTDAEIDALFVAAR